MDLILKVSILIQIQQLNPTQFNANCNYTGDSFWNHPMLKHCLHTFRSAGISNVPLPRLERHAIISEG